MRWENTCPICGFETRRDGETVVCYECGDVTDAVYDGFVVRLQDLDDSDTTPGTAEDGFRRAWGQAMRGETRPIDDLWEDE